MVSKGGILCTSWKPQQLPCTGFLSHLSGHRLYFSGTNVSVKKCCICLVLPDTQPLGHPLHKEILRLRCPPGHRSQRQSTHGLFVLCSLGGTTGALTPLFIPLCKPRHSLALRKTWWFFSKTGRRVCCRLWDSPWTAERAPLSLKLPRWLSTLWDETWVSPVLFGISLCVISAGNIRLLF